MLQAAIEILWKLYFLLFLLMLSCNFNTVIENERQRNS